MIRTVVKRTSKWLLYLLLLISLALLISYLSAPKWVPSQVQNFLPDTLKIRQLNIQRPGLKSAFVDALEIDIASDSPMTLKLENIQLHYSLLQRRLTAIHAEKAWLQITASSSNAKTVLNNRILIPALPLDELRLEQLQISGLFIQDLIFKQLELKNSDNQLTVHSKLNFIDLDFDLNSKINLSENVVDKFAQSIAIDLKQNEDHFALTLSPQTNNYKGFDWKIFSSINSKNYYPIPGLSKIAIKGSGSFLAGKHYEITLNPDFSLESPISLKELDLTPDIEALLKEKSLQLDLSPLNEVLNFSLTTEQTTQIAYNPESYQISLTHGDLPINIQQPLANIELALNQLHLSPLESLASPEQSMAGTLKFNSRLMKPSYSTKELTAKTQELMIAFNSQFSIKNTNLVLTTDNLSLKVAASNFKSDAVNTAIAKTLWHGSAKVHQNLIGEDDDNLQEIQLKQFKPISLTFNLADEQLVVENLSNQLIFDGKQLTIHSKAKTAQFKQSQLNLHELVTDTFINLQSQKLRGTATFKDANYRNQQVEAIDISGKIAWSKSGNNIYSKGQLAHQGIKLPFQYRLKLDKQAHHLELEPSKFLVSPLIQWLNPIMKDFPQLSISGGEISSQRLSGNPLALTFDGSFSLKDLNLYYEELSLHNLQLEDKLTSSSALNGSVTASIDKIEIATGIDIKKIKFQLQHTEQNILVTKVSGQLLDGSISITELSLQKDRIEPFHVSLQNIDFGKLLKALKSESLNVEGNFDFELPITIDKDSQTITDGTFSSTQAGILKVDSGASAETNIAFQALKNFHYNEFSGVINYDADGIYRLKILLKGANPDLYDGFPIELSMNLEGNLPNLLYSMLISGDMAKPIIKKYQSGELELPENP